VISVRPSLEKTAEVEPLSDARWARIERGVFDSLPIDGPSSGPVQRRDPAPGRFRLAGALVLAGALAAVLGAVAWRTLVQPPAPVAAPTRVETAANGSHVEFGESTVDVGPESSVRLSGDDARGVLVRLDTGRVECDVTPRHGRPPFVVEAGPVEVRVIGTHFVVTRQGLATSVDVQRGQVEVTSDGSSSLVAAGQHWPAASAAVEPAPSLPATPAPEPVRTPVDVRVGPPTTAPTLPSSPRARYEAASLLEPRQPEAALAIYRDLARQGGAWGQNALFAEGRLETDRGNRDEARRLLREYLARYPSGGNAGDARELLDRLR
jgi:hypothetical protein